MEKSKITIPVKSRRHAVKASPAKIPKKYIQELNDEQLKVVTHDTGPALVIAGAGSGKTRVLTYRVAWLVEKGVDPRNIMLVTFTKRAAEEMISRVEKLVSVSKDTIMAGTFHHVAGLFLRQYAKYINYEPNFTILDRDDEEQLFKKVLGAYLQARHDDIKKRFPKAETLADIYSKSVNLQKSIALIVITRYHQYDDQVRDIETIIAHYGQEKRKQNVMDFDDLLVNFLTLIHMESIGEEIRGLVKYLLVDEYQDVNQIQADIVIELGKGTKSTMVVGDDAQAIFAFRGSEIKHILEFPERFKVPVATYYLVQNYRSTPEILAFANASIKHNKKQYPKELRTVNEQGDKPFIVQCETKDEEANFICQYVLQARDQGVPLHEQAVLFRTSFQSQLLEKMLLQYDIPYEIRAGMRFYEKAHIKDLLSFAFIIENPSYAIAWERILTLLPGMGPRNAGRVLENILGASDPLAKFITLNAPRELADSKMSKEALDHLGKMQAMYREILMDEITGKIFPENELPPPSKMMERFLTFYEPLINKKYDHTENRLDDVRELTRLAARYPSLEPFLAEIAVSDTFVAPVSITTQDAEERPLVLSTVHQAKGLEWTNVHIIGVMEDMFPHARSKTDDNDFEEERRLFYVASTRAKKQLVISYSMLVDRNAMHGMNVICHRSSFIDEVEPDDVFEKLQLEYEFERA